MECVGGSEDEDTTEAEYVENQIHATMAVRILVKGIVGSS
jgi:hypothetical protein